MRAHRVRALLMGGQACISYGAAEFSRDVDLAILASSENLDSLGSAMADLGAEVIAVPPFETRHLLRGHAIHFRCHHPDVKGLRVYVMSVMREVEPFETLWSRRTSLELPDGTSFDLLSLPDLVQAKKTQRDKDWPMIRRLVEADYFQRQENATAVDLRFWLRELRTPELLIALAALNRELCLELMPERPLLEFAERGDQSALSRSLSVEEETERDADRRYWEPLRKELEDLRHRKSGA